MAQTRHCPPYDYVNGQAIPVDGGLTAFDAVYGKTDLGFSAAPCATTNQIVIRGLDPRIHLL